MRLKSSKANFWKFRPAEFVTRNDEELTKVSRKPKVQIPKSENQTANLQYIFLPLIFLTVALLGGLRLDQTDNAFLFLKPALVCLIFATLLLVLFFRSGLLKLDGWFNGTLFDREKRR